MCIVYTLLVDFKRFAFANGFINGNKKYGLIIIDETHKKVVEHNAKILQTLKFMLRMDGKNSVVIIA